MNDKHKLTLIGGRSSLPGLFHGPLYYWLGWPFFLLAGGNPLGVAVFWAGSYALFIGFYISSKSNDHLIRKYSVIDRLFHIVIWPAARQQSAKKDKLNQIRRQRNHDTSITHTSHYIHVIRFTLATLRSFMDSRPLMKHNLYTPR